MNYFYECLVAGMLAFPFVSAFTIVAAVMIVSSIGIVGDFVKLFKKGK